MDTRKLFYKSNKKRLSSNSQGKSSLKGLKLSFNNEKIVDHPLAANILLYSIKIYQGLYYLRNIGIFVFVCAFLIPLISWFVSLAIWSVIVAIIGRLFLKQFIDILNTYLS